MGVLASLALLFVGIGCASKCPDGFTADLAKLHAMPTTNKTEAAKAAVACDALVTKYKTNNGCHFKDANKVQKDFSLDDLKATCTKWHAKGETDQLSYNAPNN